MKHAVGGVQTIDRQIPIVPIFRAIFQWILVELLLPLSGIRVTIIGDVPENGPYIIASNHSSHLDTVVILRGVGRINRRRLRIAASRSYFFQSSNGMHRAAQVLFNLIPASGHDLVCCVKRLRSNNEIMLIYPEGTRSRTGEIGRFNFGIGKMHKESAIPIIPMAVRGTRNCMPTGSVWAKRGTIDLIIGEPLVLVDLDAETITMIVEKTVLDLLQQ